MKAGLRVIISALLFAAGLIVESLGKSEWGPLPGWILLGSAYLVGGWPVLSAALRNLRSRQFLDENFLMTVATLGAVALGAFEEAAGVMLFFQIGSLLEELALQRSRKSIRSLLALRPEKAQVKAGDRVTSKPAAEVAVGEILLVRPGERIPLDGTVVSGSSWIDASALTGESRPREAAAGRTVLAGSINLEGLLEVRAERALADSSISRILSLVEEAAEKKSRTERFISRFARIYTPVVVGAALLAALLPPLLVPGQTFGAWIYRALVLLMVSCPCALVISIPLGYFGGIGLASRQGILIKGSQALDDLAAIRTVVFDKTGTLTKGTFKVVEVVPAGGYSREELLKMAAEAESHSQHPIAQSIAAAYGKPVDRSTVTGVQEMRGLGVKARVGERELLAGNDPLLHREGIAHQLCRIPGTVVHLAENSRYAGYLRISDETREESDPAVRSLRASGVRRLFMLTGDNREVAEPVFRQLGLDGFQAELLPEGKLRVLEETLAGCPGKVAFVGDGINDAPVIARADVGIAMGKNASDAAVETADVVLMGDSLGQVAEAIRTGRRTRSVVRQNIILALSVKGLFLVLGAVGEISLWGAVFGDIGVALLAILNALRTIQGRINQNESVMKKGG